MKTETVRININDKTLRNLIRCNKQLDKAIEHRTTWSALGAFPFLYSRMTNKIIRDKKIDALRKVQKNFFIISQLLFAYFDLDQVGSRAQHNMIFAASDKKNLFNNIILMKDEINDHFKTAVTKAFWTETFTKAFCKEPRHGTCYRLLTHLSLAYKDLGKDLVQHQEEGSHPKHTDLSH